MSENQNIKKQIQGFFLFGLATFFALCLPVGLGTFVFYYGNGASYLSRDSKACANCHVMNDEYNAWKMGDHRSFAQCNDCHMPHNTIAKIASKVSNGFFHSLAFTTGNFVDPIQIKPHNRKIVEASCKNCHQGLIEDSRLPGSHLNQTSCLHCHQGVGHGRR